jgi:radical SAM protein with 4Fe4S-binding SPASM domain
MQELQYRKFSSRTHQRIQQTDHPSSCQFELTFGCPLHCRHCYSDCYNSGRYLKKELNTKNVKAILDKIRQEGVIWLCFTGGDPLIRRDFPDIYSYARRKGFLVSVFTSGCSLTKEMLALFNRQPPFVIEMTLNAEERRLYEHISRVKGSFARAMESIRLLRAEKIPLKIKTMVTKDNVSHLSQIKEFIAGHGLSFNPDYHLFSRLNGDKAPLRLRVSPGAIIAATGKAKQVATVCEARPPLKNKDNKLFWCALGSGQEFHIDPYGNFFLCPAIRAPRENIINRPIKPVLLRLIERIREEEFSGRTKCASCRIRGWCLVCPGKAYSLTGNKESASRYYCRLTEEFLKQ